MSAYQSWLGMKGRCLNPNHADFRNYGGKGIKVCDRWFKYKDFLVDMGERPEGTTIDRYPNPNGNYELSNCRWATKSQQNSNRRPYGKSGFTGVYRSPNGKRFIARIGYCGKFHYIGSFETKELASLAFEACKSVLISSKEEAQNVNQYRN